jgi:nitroimidazol reductase NimA-like FMN-containing flavoprotein (pyridoxamine 5'-phosphate oxidase superfamily)
VSDTGKYGACAMTRDEVDEFLAATDVVMLASLRRDGAPFVVPVGFDWDGESFWVTIARDHAGVARLRRDGRVSLATSSHPAFPAKFVVVEGIAEELADPGDAVSRRILFRKSQEMFARLAVDREQFFAQWISVGRIVFRIQVTRSTSFDGTKVPKGDRYTAGTRLPTDSVRTRTGEGDSAVGGEHPA